jgi:hypothetical protein
MLVTFRTNAYANITMFGDVAKQLLEPGAQRHNSERDQSRAGRAPPLARLEAAVEQRRAAGRRRRSDRGRGHHDAPRKVIPSQRACPLPELLRAAVGNKAPT